MKHITVVLGAAVAMAALATGLLAAGCSPTSYIFGGGTPVPAHTERRYAAMSLPAFAADGSLYVMNGATLLHYAAGGQRLGSSALPVSIPASHSLDADWPRAYATRGGDVFVTSSNKRIGLLNGSQQFAWVADTGAAYTPLPLGDGLLVQDKDVPVAGVAYLDLTGAVRWNVPWTQLYSDMVQVDEQDRAYFCHDNILTVIQADGDNVLQVTYPTIKDGLWLNDARADRVLLGANGAVICIDLAGERLWRITPPGGAGNFLGSRVLGPDRFVLHVSNWPQDVLVIVDGQGQILQQSQEKASWQLLLANGSGYLAEYRDTLNVNIDTATWVWFNADGVELWRYHPPQRIRDVYQSQDSPVAVYPYGGRPALGADGRIYFERNSTLYALDLQGHVVWQDAGGAYNDVWVDNSCVFDFD